MKTLSIQQPWSWLIANGIKDIENRDWTTSYRGLVFIHAGKKLDPNCFDGEDLFTPFLYRGGASPRLREYVPLHKADYEIGGIVGYATLKEVVTKSNSPWFRGRYGFVLTGQHPVPFIPLRGQLGLFDVPAETIEQLLLKAAERNDDDLENLLQVVIEEMAEPQATRLLDKVHQVLKEDMRDLTGWKS